MSRFTEIEKSVLMSEWAIWKDEPNRARHCPACVAWVFFEVKTSIGTHAIVLHGEERLIAWLEGA